MRKTICKKNQKLSKEYETFMQNIERYLEIANAVTETISSISRNAEKAISYEQRCNIVIKNLDIFIELFQKCNQEIYKSYSMLDLAGKNYEIDHFTCPESGVNEYKVNDVGECVITNTNSVPPHHCHIFNVKKPPLKYLDDFRGKKITRLPESGEVFAIELGSDGLCRAVRNDFVNEGSEAISIQLIDTGESKCVRRDCGDIYELPKSNFKIVGIRNSIPFIKITTKSPVGPVGESPILQNTSSKDTLFITDKYCIITFS